MSRSNSANTASFQQAMKNLPGVLTKLGFPSLRKGQDRAVFNLFMRRDTFCVLPTGGGKSAIYIIPSLCLNLRCLIFSPLVALMKDQVESLWRYNLNAEQISSAQTDQENKMALMNWEVGDVQFMLVAPERLNSENFMETMEKAPPDLVVVDEAHCLSEWGHNFRSAYMRIGDFLKRIRPPTVLCLTATATEEVEADIRRVLEIEEAHRIIYFPKRENLVLSSRNFEGMVGLKRLINEIDGPTIVYCNTRKHAEECYELTNGMLNRGGLVYHGGMTTDERDAVQNQFMTDEVGTMFATNAFGLGVNKPNIRAVIHRDVPSSVEALSQEMGRAGRDGQKSQCVALYDEKSFGTNRWLIDTANPTRDFIEQAFYFLKRNVDKESSMQMTITEMAQRSRLEEKTLGSALQILTSFKVLARGKDDERPATVTLVKDHLDPVLQKYIEAVQTHGQSKGAGSYEVSLNFLAQQLGVKAKNLTDKLKLLDKNGYVVYTAPYRGSTTKLVGDLTMVDFEKLRRKRDDAFNKLDSVQMYLDTPDENKHDFLLNYFDMR